MSDIVSNKPKSAVTGKPSPKHGCCDGGIASHENEPTATDHTDHACCGDAKPATAAHSSCGGNAASGTHKHRHP